MWKLSKGLILQNISFLILYRKLLYFFYCLPQLLSFTPGISNEYICLSICLISTPPGSCFRLWRELSWVKLRQVLWFGLSGNHQTNQNKPPQFFENEVCFAPSSTRNLYPKWKLLSWRVLLNQAVGNEAWGGSKLKCHRALLLRFGCFIYLFI